MFTLVQISMNKHLKRGSKIASWIWGKKQVVGLAKLWKNSDLLSEKHCSRTRKPPSYLDTCNQHYQHTALSVFLSFFPRFLSTIAFLNFEGQCRNINVSLKRFEEIKSSYWSIWGIQSWNVFITLENSHSTNEVLGVNSCSLLFLLMLVIASNTLRCDAKLQS